MTDALDQSALERWRLEPIAFVVEMLRNPETGRPFDLLPAQRRFFAHAFATDDTGRLLYPEQVFACQRSLARPASRRCTC